MLLYSLLTVNVLDISVCFAGVEGIDRDVTKAVTLLEQSAKQGLEQAQLYLGLCYSNSKHMPQDLERSAKLLKAAAQREVMGSEVLDVMDFITMLCVFVMIESGCAVQSWCLL